LVESEKAEVIVQELETMKDHIDELPGNQHLIDNQDRSQLEIDISCIMSDI